MESILITSSVVVSAFGRPLPIIPPRLAAPMILFSKEIKAVLLIWLTGFHSSSTLKLVYCVMWRQHSLLKAKESNISENLIECARVWLFPLFSPFTPPANDHLEEVECLRLTRNRSRTRLSTNGSTGNGSSERFVFHNNYFRLGNFCH